MWTWGKIYELSTFCGQDTSLLEPGGLWRIKYLASNLSGLAPVSGDIFSSPVLCSQGFTACAKGSVIPAHRAIASGKCGEKYNSLDSVNGEEGKSPGAKSFPESVVIMQEACIKS